MTEQNYQYRTSQNLLRNQFDGDGPFQIPIIPKASFSEKEFQELMLIGFDKARADDEKNRDRMVHFFLYDYKFERVWKDAARDLERLKNYRAVLSPDFSMYIEMNPTIQLYNTFRNRWCGAYWSNEGLRVVPTISWGNEKTFEFCFLGVPKGSTVAVSTYMVSEHDNHNDQKDFFMAGYREMLRQIEPERIICYNTPFPEMEGNIVFVDYELSSWKYQGKEYKLSPYVKYISGELPLPENTGIVLKQGYVVSEEKGMGSVYGGTWRPNPNKPTDQRFLGKPGEIKTTITTKGDTYRTKIGSDGRAERERHETVHNRGDKHTNPHDHEINWDNLGGHPVLGPPINYPDGAPEFKEYRSLLAMDDSNIIFAGNDNFVSIGDFERSLSWGAEIEFEWKGVLYGVIRYGTDHKITIYQCGHPETEKVCETAEEALEYMVGEDRLRDVITQVRVVERTI